MRIPAKIIAVLILLIAVVALTACGKDTPPTPNTYTVTFSSQFNNTESATTIPIPTYKTVTSPTTTIDALPTPPTMSGYTFGGWYTEPNGQGVNFTTSTQFSSDLIVYAYWYKYKVTFNSETSTAYAIIGVTHPATTTEVLPPPPTKTGNIFAGWWTGTNGSGIQFFATTPVPPDITVYAKWIPSTNTVYTVTYDSNGGTAVGTQYVISGNTVVTLPTPDPAKPCKDFLGWYTEAGFITLFTADTTVNADITVYANWSTNEVRTVTYNSGWGSSVETQCVTVPDFKVVTTLPTPAKRCYNFSGWYTGKKGAGDYFTNDTVVPPEGITVYANWTLAGYTPPSTYEIGDPGPSCVGKVFYVTDGGTHGLEAAPPGWSDEYAEVTDPYSAWIYGDPYTDPLIGEIQRTQQTLNGNTLTAIGTGFNNSNNIIAQTGHTASAAQLCKNYKGGDLTGWFLSSKDELAQLYAYRDAKRWGGFSEDSGYWSSSENNFEDAWSQSFANGSQPSTLKGSGRQVRPIRAF